MQSHPHGLSLSTKADPQSIRTSNRKDIRIECWGLEAPRLAWASARSISLRAVLTAKFYGIRRVISPRDEGRGDCEVPGCVEN